MTWFRKKMWRYLFLLSMMALLLTACTGPAAEETDNADLTCTFSISCNTVLANMDLLTSGKEELIPEDGCILAPVTVPFSQGDSVFTLLQQVVKEYGIHMEYSNTPVYKSAYIEGIGNLYEYDCGELSGWMYKVNDYFPNFGCSQYYPEDGDVIAFVYTCDLGKDVGSSILEE